MRVCALCKRVIIRVEQGEGDTSDPQAHHSMRDQKSSSEVEVLEGVW